MKSYKFILLFLLLASQARTQSSVCFQRLSEDASGFYVTVSYSCEQRCVSDISFGYYLISPSGQIISKSTALTRYDFPAGIGTKVIFITNQQSNPEGQLVYLQLNIAVFDANNPGLGSGFSFARNSRDQLFCSDGKGGNCCFYPTPLSNVACNISATSTTEPVICSGGLGSASLTVTGGRLPPYAYAWSNGATTSTINAPSGTYSVTVTDASGSCSITKDNIVIEDKKLSIITTAQARVCGAPKGTASATVTGGRGPYLYEWNNLNNTRGLTVSYTSITEPPGTYRVQIIDAANCSVTADIVIEDGCACNLSLSATKGSESGCPNNPMAEHLVVLQGVSSGSVSFNYKLSSTSANSTFTPQYLNNSLSTAIIWTIPPGKYLIEVEDALHCKKSLNFEYISNCPLDCTPHIDNCQSTQP